MLGDLVFPTTHTGLYSKPDRQDGAEQLMRQLFCPFIRYKFNIL